MLELGLVTVAGGIGTTGCLAPDNAVNAWDTRRNPPGDVIQQHSFVRIVRGRVSAGGLVIGRGMMSSKCTHGAAPICRQVVRI
jgi:hypothetical protein